jgi:diguanylate cyclase (GGDEF)-like protein
MLDRQKIRRRLLEASSVTLPLAAAAGLAWSAVRAPVLFLELAGGLTTVGFLVAALVVARGARARLVPSLGFVSLVLGLLFLAAASTLRTFPHLLEAAEGSLPVGAGAVPGILSASGALGVAFGSIFWARRLVDRFVFASSRERTLSRGVEHLKVKLESQKETLRELDILDNLTGVLNRRAFLDALEEVIERDTHLDEPFAFLLVRVVDHLETCESQGREAGDRLVREVARALKNGTRGTDTVGRLGSEEFGVVLSECQDPQPVLGRIIFALEGGRGARKRNPVRVHVGAVTVTEPGEAPRFAELNEIADRAIAALPEEERSQVARKSYARRRPSRAQAS